MKKMLSTVLGVALTVSLVAGCSAKAPETTAAPPAETKAEQTEAKAEETEAAKEASQGEGKTYDKPELVLRYAEVNSGTDERALASEEFAQIIKEKTGGRIEIQVFPSAQLGDNKEVFQNMQIGAIDMSNLVPVQFVDYGINVPYLKVLGIPFLFRDEEHAINVMNGDFGNKVIEDINGSGGKVVVLDFFVAGSRSFFTKKPVNTLADFKGLKIRVQQDEVYMDMIKSFGGSPTPIAMSELYSALQTGVVDGAENPIKGYFNNKFYEVAPHYIYSNHMIEPSSITISEATWNKLTDEERQLFIETAKTVTEDFQKAVDEKKSGQIEELKKAGVEFHELEDYDEWVAAAAPLAEKYGAGFEDVIKQIKDVK